MTFMLRLLVGLWLCVPLSAWAGNSLTTNPVVIQTPSATALDTTNRAIIGIMAVGMVTAGDSIILQDSAGNPIWIASAASTNYMTPFAVFNPPLGVHGLKVPTLTSGQLYIYTK